MRRLRAAPNAGLVVLVCLWAAAPAEAATIPVSTPADGFAADGQCGLREAVATANNDAAANGCPAGSGADTILLPAGSFFLTVPGSGENDNASGDLDIAGELTLAGAGAEATTIDANGLDRAVQVLPGATVTIRELTITGGRPPAGATGADGTSMDPNVPASGGSGLGGSGGGGIFSAGTLTIDATTVRGNEAGDGGDGGDATGATSFFGVPGGSAFSGSGGPGGFGGGISSTGALTVTRSRIVDNVAGAGGTGGDAQGGAGSAPLGGMFGVNGSTGGDAFADDGGRGGAGGGISSSGPLVIASSTISGNRSGDGGSSGSATGGRGGNAHSVGNNTGGNGGRGFLTTVAVGTGGNGGGVASLGTLTLSDSSVFSNRAGAGGAGRDSTGGAGGTGNASGSGGNGGSALGNFGSTGGNGGGVFAQEATTIERATIADNVAGKGGPGGAGTGGAAGAGGATGAAGAAGQGNGENGGDGGFGGGVLGVFGLALSTATIDANEAGDGGPAGPGSGGSGSGGGGGGRGGSGGGVGTFGNTLDIAGATITGNLHGQPGANAAPFSGSGNPGLGGAIHKFTTGAVSIRDTIVAVNLAPSCSSAEGFAGDNNLHHPIDVGCPGAEGDPQLGPLAGNGGPTQTRALPAGSPALDRFMCSGVDQRGVTRPFGAACDIGAYERAAPAVVPEAASPVGSTTATLRAGVNPNARPTTVVFDYGRTEAYGSATAPQTIPAGVSVVSVAAAIGGLRPATAYHFRARATNADGEVAGPDQVFTTARDTTPPSLTRLRVDPPAFAVAPRSPANVAGRRIPRATRVRFRLSEAATVRLAFARKTVGARVRGRCRRSKGPIAKRRRCTLFVPSGSLRRRGKRGANAIRFSGRIRSKALPRASYRLTATARDGAGNRSKRARAKFRIVRAR